MRTTTFFRTSAVATIFALLISAGTALADRDGKGGGKNGGGDNGGRSGSNDRSGGSSRSSGGDRSSSNRPSSRSSDGNKGNSNGPSTFRSNKGSDDSNKDFKDFQPPKQFQGRADQSGQQSRDSRDYKVLRPSDDKGRDFLKDNDNNKNNKDADRFKNRNPKDREVVDREYGRWQNTWNGNKNDKNDKGDIRDNKFVGGKNNHDNRDWSGKWRNSDRFTTADRIRNDWRGRRGNDFVFNDNWWNGRHRGNYWNFWGNYGRRYNNPYYWWGWTNGARLGSWFVFGWPTPYYWDYGQGEYIYCDNGAVYVNGRWYEPAPVFYQQTVQLIDQNPPLTADTAAKLDWMPLGVFAATPDGLNEPEVTVQLATTKEGQIGGTAFDPKTSAAYNIQGTVDKKTQRAVWAYTNDQNRRIMMETSVYNLTQPEATGMVHYSPTDMRVVELVRLEQPEAGAENSSPSLPAPPVNQ